MVVGSIPMLDVPIGGQIDPVFLPKRLGNGMGSGRRATGALRLRVRKGMALTAGSECVARRMTQASKSELSAFLTK